MGRRTSYSPQAGIFFGARVVKGQKLAPYLGQKTVPRNAPKMHSEQSKFLFLATVVEHGPSEQPKIERGADNARKLSGSSFTASVSMFDHNK